MKKFFLLIALCLASFPYLTVAQELKNWDFGISAELGRDYYNRKYSSHYDSNPYLLKSFQSRYSWGGGVWVERHINRNLSGQVRVSYNQQDMFPDTYHSPSRTANKFFLKEKHHHIISDIGARWYINPASTIKFFFDAKIGVNNFVALDLYEIEDGKMSIEDIYGYDRVQPLGLIAVGVKWRRLAVMAEYNRDLRRAEKSGYDYVTILRQGLTVKATFAIVNAH